VCFDEYEYVRLSVTVQTAALGITRYSNDQLELFRQVCRLRATMGLTFREIAERLKTLGYKSASDRQLSQELVFSIWKKGTARSRRFSASMTL
jgi:DNA-binding transcriptional MerR regulator